MSEYTISYLNEEGSKHAMANLIKCVEHGEPFVTYGGIGRHLEQRLSISRVFATRIGGVVGTMMDKILVVDPDAPLLNALTTRSNGIPGEGVAGYIDQKYLKESKKKWADLSDKKKLKIVERIRQDVRSYSKWDEIYQNLWGEQVADNFPEEEINEDSDSNRSGSGYGGPAESDEHKALKEWVAKNPAEIGIPERFGNGKSEFKLLSGDVVDVLFSDGKSFFAVEVKSVISSDDDFRRGLYQCVKYCAVLEAQELPVKADVTGILVTERDLGGELKRRRKLFEIKHIVTAVN